MLIEPKMSTTQSRTHLLFSGLCGFLFHAIVETCSYNRALSFHQSVHFIFSKDAVAVEKVVTVQRYFKHLTGAFYTGLYDIILQVRLSKLMTLSRQFIRLAGCVSSQTM